MDVYRLTEIVADMLDVSALLPDDTKIDAQAYKDYITVTIDGVDYEIKVSCRN